MSGMRVADLVLRGGRVIDPASGRDETADIAFGDGTVTEIARDLPASGAEIVDVRGMIVAPGLIDLHTHVYWGGTSLGVEAVEVARESGTTTFVASENGGEGDAATVPAFRADGSQEPAAATEHYAADRSGFRRHTRPAASFALEVSVPVPASNPRA